MLIVTNNPKVKQQLKKTANLVFVEGPYGDVLNQLKEMIVAERSTLLSHPLSGSIKPNETYYNTVLVSKKQEQYIHLESLEYIESAIQVYEKFVKGKERPQWTEDVLTDFAFVDYYIAKSTLQRMGVLDVLK